MRVSTSFLLIVLAAGCSGGSETKPTEPSAPEGSAVPSPPTAVVPPLVVDAGPPAAATDNPAHEVPPPLEAALATDLEAVELAFYHPHKVALARRAEDGGASKLDAPIAAKREGLVRLFVNPQPNYAARPLTAKLFLRSRSGAIRATFEDTQTITSATTEEALGSGFRFVIPANTIDTETHFTVAIVDPAAPLVKEGATSTAWLPQDGTSQRANVVGVGDTLDVVLVPYADPTGREPKVDAARVTEIERAILRLFPTPKVSLTVHAKQTYSTTITHRLSALSDAVDVVLALRESENAPASTYYVGLFKPASPYCEDSADCYGGQAASAVAADQDQGRAAMMLLEDDDTTYTNVVHELGHLHGLFHAPCGSAAGPDPRYPYAGGAIGAPSYDLVQQTLIASSGLTDVMGYCDSNWISDFHADLLVRRMAYLAEPRAFTRTLAAPNVAVLLGANGEPRRARFSTMAAPSGPGRAIDIETASGVVGAVAVFRPLSEGGGYLIAPSPPQGATFVSVDGKRLAIGGQP